MVKNDQKDNTAEESMTDVIAKLAGKFTAQDKAKANRIAERISNELNKEFEKQTIEEVKSLSIEKLKQLDQANSYHRLFVINKVVDEVGAKMGDTLENRELVKRYMLTNKNGTIKPDSRENIYRILAFDEHCNDMFRYNEFTEEVEYRKNNNSEFEQANKNLIARLIINIERYYRLVVSEKSIKTALLLAAQDHSYDPIKQRIETVKWDGKHRVATFFIDYLGAENNKYTKAVTEAWFTALVGRVYHPGLKCDMVPVLVGKQGIGKSTLVSLLCPPRYFDDSLKTMGQDKDDQLKVHEAWVVEIGELEAMNNTSISRTKQFVASLGDKYRAPYDSETQYHPRKNMFIGTVNSTEFLHDLTGNRRFYPINCVKSRATKNVPQPNDYDNEDILQVLAEAKVMYDNGHSVYLPDDIEEIAHTKQAEATVEDQQVSLMLEYSNLLVPEDWDKFSVYQRQQYWKRYKEYGEYTKTTIEDGTANYKKYHGNELHPLDQFTSAEILQVVFERSGKEVGRGGRNSLTSKLSMLFDNDKHWYRSDNCKFQGHRKKGFKRKPHD